MRYDVTIVHTDIGWTGSLSDVATHTYSPNRGTRVQIHLPLTKMYSGSTDYMVMARMVLNKYNADWWETEQPPFWLANNTRFLYNRGNIGTITRHHFPVENKNVEPWVRTSDRITEICVCYARDNANITLEFTHPWGIDSMKCWFDFNIYVVGFAY
uniref:Uncharacterized protein n=1 Tax=Soybean thrips tombus-like virus 2 TaxID=2802944 RepID=A0A7T8G242_9TOMB|nr:hypothetical protein 3 [Soybean thrips tombus-like virus 2]